MKRIFGIIGFLFLYCFSYATHQVGGYISFKCLGGTTYQATITSYTNTYLTTADRDTMRIWWGDGTSEVLTRINGPIYAGDPVPNGEPICNYDFNTDPPTPLEDARKINIYVGTHTYPGPGTYRSWMDDPDRMAYINNINGSVSVDYLMYNSLTISPFNSGCVNTPLIVNAPVCQYGCTGVCYTYNPGAYIPTPPADPNDSIVYAMGISLSLGFQPAGNYYNPGATVGRLTGTLTWCNPSEGKWNFVILMITMHRTYVDGTKLIVPIDTAELELEVIINSNCNYNPTITSKDTCVEAGGKVTINYTARDKNNNGKDIYITDAGEPFSLTPPAVLSNYFPPAPLLFPKLTWNTNCPEVRANPYEVVIRATEKIPGGGFPIPDTNYFSAYGTSMITVVGPAPTNLKAVVTGTTVCLSWDPSICPQAIGYNIFRAIGCKDFDHSVCETGVPPSSGFTLLASTSGINNTTYCDSNNGAGLSPGADYSYIVDAYYPEASAAQSYASNDTCVLIKLSVPVITNVSVSQTGKTNGNMFIRWLRPIADTNNLDTNQYAPPYKYALQHAQDMSSRTFGTIATFTYSTFKAIPPVSTYTDPLLNTQDYSYNYRVQLYYTDKISGGFKLVGNSGTASSIYLRLQRGDSSMRLGWAAMVPWSNDTFFVYRKNPSSSVYNFIKEVTGTTTYTDNGLTNDSTYCYYVKSSSHYDDTNITHPLYDSSETVCGTPQDTIAPCSPPLTITAKCNLYLDSIVWSNPDRICPKANKVTSYQIWYSPTENGDLGPIATITDPNDTIFVNSNLTSVAGCYVVYAFDKQGQASSINKVCVDNCPIYTLPNVFTPNGDNVNDMFTPLEPYRYVKDIDINIYNRWGQVMFHTTNPNINWNGTDQHSGQPCPDGVYYYICTVNEIRLAGIVPITLKGFIEIIRAKN